MASHAPPIFYAKEECIYEAHYVDQFEREPGGPDTKNNSSASFFFSDISHVIHVKSWIFELLIMTSSHDVSIVLHFKASTVLDRLCLYIKKEISQKRTKDKLFPLPKVIVEVTLNTDPFR